MVPLLGKGIVMSMVIVRVMSTVIVMGMVIEKYKLPPKSETAPHPGWQDGTILQPGK